MIKNAGFMTIIKIIKSRSHSETVVFGTFIWVLAIFSLCQSEWTRLHMGLNADWFSMSFYYFIPAAIWTLTFPLVRKLSQEFSKRSGTIRSLLDHVAISIVLASTIKFFALLIDFLIKDAGNPISVTFLEFLYSVRYLFIGSTLDNVVIYWMLVGALHLFGEKKNLATPIERFNNSKEPTPGIGINRIASGDILFIEAFGNYLKIHTPSNVICMRGTIKSVLTELDPAIFFRVHRSFIVNKSQVKMFFPGRTQSIVMCNGMKIKVGFSYRKSVGGILGPERD
jgi:hypothetical protein